MLAAIMLGESFDAIERNGAIIGSGASETKFKHLRP